MLYASRNFQFKINGYSIFYAIMKNNIITTVSWLIVAWACYIFLGSIPYKFSNHPDTQHIFSTIGNWMSTTIADGLGQSFAQYGAYVVGSFEIATSAVLLFPLFGLFFKCINRARFHFIGGLMASAVMFGAVFFHLFTPLGIKVLHQGQSDGGSLFYAATSILIGGLVLAFINRKYI